MKKRLACLLISSAAALTACKHSAPEATTSIAPGAPGVKSYWSYAGKTGIGTSYEVYTNGQYSDSGTSGKISKVWFSLAQGVLTETMFGMIHEAQLQEAQFYIKGDNFLDEEKKDTISTIDYLDKDDQGRPLSLAYKVVNKAKNGQYEIEKHFFTDPDTNTMVMKVYFRALADNITPYLYINPNMANTGPDDKAWSENGTWFAADGTTHLAVKTDALITKSTVGFEGVSDGIADLKTGGKLSHSYTSTGDTLGNVAMTLQLPSLKKAEMREWQFVFGFGNSKAESIAAATQTLSTGSEKVLANYNGKGDAVGWEDYMASLTELGKLSAVSTDGGKLLYASALVLKAQEDKTYAGGIIASLSNPWGETSPAEKSQTGYKAVWPRDFYQVTMAMLAMGDKITPKVAFDYLQHVQVSDKTPGNTGATGWFLQKTHVDGEIEWAGVQVDQTAMPIMLGWRLWKDGIISDAEMLSRYNSMLKPAANFLVDGGTIGLQWNHDTIRPPMTQQDRWEEQPGYSPSTTAATITGLVAAADIAKLAKDEYGAKRFLKAADKYSGNLEKTMVTTKGVLNKAPSNGKYLLRINSNENPNDNGVQEPRNGKPGITESESIDGGFLELVRYGVRSPLSASILETLPEIDDTNLPDELRLRYDFTFPGVAGTFPVWRRYGNDGYGEDIYKGKAYPGAKGPHTPESRGRVWPLLDGERGQYELAKATAKGPASKATIENLRNTYVKVMELFANEGLMLPEQVWEGVGNNDTYHFTTGKGTNTATPLSWSHAEYVKLLRSYTDQKVWDKNDSTAERYRNVK